MKNFLLAAAIFSATSTTVFAQGVFPPPPTQEVVKASKVSMVSKTTQLEQSIKNNKPTQTDKIARQILKGMKERVRDTRFAAEAKTGADRDALMQRMLMVENRVAAYMKLMKDIPTNKTQLVAQAKAFTADF